MKKLYIIIHLHDSVKFKIDKISDHILLWLLHVNFLQNFMRHQVN